MNRNLLSLLYQWERKYIKLNDYCDVFNFISSMYKSVTI